MTKYSAGIAVLSAGLVLATAALPAAAQTRPHHSGHLSHNAPQMRRHGSGFHRPNLPTHHHFFGHPGYHGHHIY